jgi:LPXTG-motif cell wall-anchored protein
VDGVPAVAVTLAVYGTHPDPELPYPYAFNIADNQQLLDSVSCGVGTKSCESGTEHGAYSLSLVIPSAWDAGADPCFAQVDAVLGAPLAVVGPNGSYYTAATRGGSGPDMLIDAAGADIDMCSIDTTTTTTAPPETTTTEATPPETPSTVPTTEAPATVPTTEAPADVAPTEAVAVAGVSATQQLPATGAHTGVLVMLGSSLLVLGAAALVLVRVRDFAGTTR